MKSLVIISKDLGVVEHQELIERDASGLGLSCLDIADKKS